MKNLITGFFLIIAFKSFSQQPIYATVASGELYSFDLTNCTRNLIGSTGHGFGDIAFTPNGQLWGIAGGQLYHIDIATANATLIGETGIGAISLVGLNDTILLAEYGMKLYGINIIDTSSYYIDTIGYQGAGDLTWYDNDLYLVTASGQIIKMVLNGNYTEILSVTPIGSSVPTSEGAVTASFAGDYNSIVGFNGPNLIKICQIDGSSQPICPNLNIGGTPGAASIRLPTQIPQPTACIMTSGIENIIANNLFSIFPNPATSEINIKTNYNQVFNFNIHNTLGQLVKTGIVESNSATIAISNLPNGIYSIELSAGNKRERTCFVIEK